MRYSFQERLDQSLLFAALTDALLVAVEERGSCTVCERDLIDTATTAANVVEEDDFAGKDRYLAVALSESSLSRHVIGGCGPYCFAYFVNPPPAASRESGPSAA